ncbi:hypothetical protein LINGRAPRIM_LOCUS2664 [Linum grandiflorum]
MDSSGGSTSRGVVADDRAPAQHTVEKINGNWHLEVIKQKKTNSGNRGGALPYNCVQSQLSKDLGHMSTRAQIWLYTHRNKDGSFSDTATPLALSDRPSSATGPSEHIGWSSQTEATITARVREEMDRVYAEKLQTELERHGKLGKKKAKSMAKKIEKKMEKKMEKKFQEMLIQFTSKGLSSSGSDDDVNEDDFIVEPLDNARYKKAFYNSYAYEYYDEDDDEDLDKDGKEYNEDVGDGNTGKGGDEEEEEEKKRKRKRMVRINRRITRVV